MTWQLFVMALLAGAANWAFRALPILLRRERTATPGWVERSLAAIGPAAIATLCVASLLPMLSSDLLALAPVIGGTLAVVGTYLARPSVVLATLAGAVVHGGMVWLLG
ncbi:MAG: hypothetical protein B7Z10_10765 [Rhodobacterales bacterium 32-66-7]|nr:MAG: hypothetical protein B7Z10_10765 [Rhodobacterales bacterium 32-66-7]